MSVHRRRPRRSRRSLAGDGKTVIRDFVLSAADIVELDAQLAEMNTIMRAEADAHGFAYFSLSALYEQVATKAPYSAITQLTSAQPYGPFISLDGVHPSAEGSRSGPSGSERAGRAVQHGLP